jgi:type VI secretion system protein ImpA
MAALDLTGLAEPIDPDQPSGENLEYDSAFLDLERTAQGRPEQQVGDTIVAAEEPDWRVVHNQALALFDRTKDLRVAVYLARALIHTEGLAGFGAALHLIRVLLEQQWPSVHPQLDADDDNDPTMRINALVAIQDPEQTLRPLREAPLVHAPRVGVVSLRDALVARNEMAPTADAEPVTQATIDAAFADTEPDVLQATAAAVAAAAADLAAIETVVLENVGAYQAPDLSALSGMLREMDHLFAQQIERTGGGPAGAGLAAPDDSGSGAEAPASGATGGRPGEIRNRNDVVRTIDQILAYYRDNEPSSPIPLLLRRAQRLASMDFLALIRELAPDGLSQIQNITGATDTDE